MRWGFLVGFGMALQIGQRRLSYLWEAELLLTAMNKDIYIALACDKSISTININNNITTCSWTSYKNRYFDKLKVINMENIIFDVIDVNLLDDYVGFFKQIFNLRLPLELNLSEGIKLDFNDVQNIIIDRNFWESAGSVDGTIEAVNNTNNVLDIINALGL